MEPRGELRDVWARAVVLSAVLSAVALVWGAMELYSGGTAWDRHSPGHDFWLNYLCDLQRSVGRNGASNALASRLTQAAMATLALSFAPQFWLVSRLCGMRGLRAASVMGLGALSSLGSLAVALMPSDTFGDWHDLAIAAGAIPGLVAVGLCIPELARTQPSRPTSLLACAFLVVASVDFVLYAEHLVAGGVGTPALPILERLSFLLLVAWMLSVVLEPGRTPSRSPTKHRWRRVPGRPHAGPGMILECRRAAIRPTA